MRTPADIRRSTAFKAGVVVLSATGLVAATALTAADAKPGPAAPAAAIRSASTTSSHHASCVSVSYVEQTVRFDYIGSDPNPTPLQKVGDTVTYYDDIFDAEGRVIGHAVGYVTGDYEPTPGHLITSYKETVQLPQGRLTTTGLMERQKMVVGDTVHLQAEGRSGAFAGKTGYRDWALQKPIQVPLTKDEKVDMSILLCG